MTYRLLKMAAILLTCGLFVGSTYAQVRSDHLNWWQDARFGMLVTWGLYSLPAHGEWIMYQEHKLENGLRILMVPVNSFQSVSIGIFVGGLALFMILRRTQLQRV